MVEEGEKIAASGPEDRSSLDDGSATDLKNGIFNLVIAYVRHLEGYTDPTVARGYVAAYLERIAEGLHSAAQPISSTKVGDPNAHETVDPNNVSKEQS